MISGKLIREISHKSPEIEHCYRTFLKMMWVLQNDYEIFVSKRKYALVYKFFEHVVMPYFEVNGEVEKHLPKASEEVLRAILGMEKDIEEKYEEIQCLNDDDIEMLLDLFDDWSLKQAEDLDFKN